VYALHAVEERLPLTADLIASSGSACAIGATTIADTAEAASAVAKASDAVDARFLVMTVSP
jgi:hypothetical protein